jgi:hypothetical protein
LVPAIGIIGDEIGLDVEELHCLLAPQVLWIGLQKTVKF